MAALTRDQLAALAASIYGSEWQSALARERGVNVRTVQRWAKDGIAKAETALAIQSYLLSRRIIDLPPPISQDDDQRDDQAHVVVPLLLEEIVGAGLRVGWHEAELLSGMLSGVVDRMVAGCGVPATIETIRSGLDQLRRRVDQ